MPAAGGARVETVHQARARPAARPTSPFLPPKNAHSSNANQLRPCALTHAQRPHIPPTSGLIEDEEALIKEVTSRPSVVLWPGESSIPISRLPEVLGADAVNSGLLVRFFLSDEASTAPVLLLPRAQRVATRARKQDA